MSTRFHKGAFEGINLARAMSEPGYALYDGDDFRQLNNTPAQTSGGYVTSEDGTATLILEDQRPGVAAKLGTAGAAAHDAAFMARRAVTTAIGMFDITLNSGRELAFEAKFKVVQGLYVGIFVGLAEVGLTDDIITDSTGAIADKDVIGFHYAIHATDVDIDGITRIETGDATVGSDTMSEDEDDTFHVYGFRFDGGTTVNWFYDNEKVDTQTLTATTIASGQALTPTFCVKHGAVGATTQSLTIMDWTCVELLLSEDRLAD